MESATGTIDGGTVRIDGTPPWADGQRVIVIAVPAEALERPAAPPDVLEEDAREFALRPDVRRALFGSEPE